MSVNFLFLFSRLTLPALAILMLMPVSALALEQLDVKATTVPVFFDLEATLEAVNQSTVSAQTSGAIVEVNVDVNDPVEAGELIIRIDDTQQKAQLEQAKANVAQAEAQNKDAQLALERTQRLRKQGSASQGELDSSEARAKSTAAGVLAAKAALQQAQEQLAYTEVRAPYSGVVKARHVEIGELVNPGQPLMTGMALEPLRAVADMPQRIAKQYQHESQIRVLLNDVEVAASKVTVFPFADEQFHSVRLRAQLESSAGAMPGQWVKVRVQTGEREAILVPQSAVLQRSELSSIYVLRNNQPQLRQVRIGNRFGGHADGQVEVLAGLKTGDTIIVDALAQLAALSKEG